MSEGIRNYSLDEAAERLRCFPSYLSENLHRLPHQKIGKAVCFDDEDLAAIKEQHRVRPDEPAVGERAEKPPLTLATITPSGRARRAAP